jgi:hypothetical protein
MEKPKINTRYAGKDSVAISKFREGYAVEYGYGGNAMSFDEFISERKNVLGEKYIILQRFDNIDIRVTSHILEEVSKKLEKGESIDLTRILEN